MTETHKPKRVTLTCNHIMSFMAPYPEIGDEVYCRQCANYSTVTSTLDEYRMRCTGCRLSRVYGRDLDRARRAGSTHVLKYGHTVSIMDATELVETIAPDGEQGTLPFDTAVNSRIEQVREHQGKLRDFLKTLPNRNVA